MHESEIHPGATLARQARFEASIDGKALQLTSLLGCLTLRPELGQASRHWVWKIIAQGKVQRKSTSIGLYLDHDLRPGLHALVSNPKIRVVFNQSPHGRNLIYHSRHLQSGTLKLIDINRDLRQLQGEFEFGISAIGFSVSRGRFDLSCPLHPA